MLPSKTFLRVGALVLTLACAATLAAAQAPVDLPAAVTPLAGQALQLDETPAAMPCTAVETEVDLLGLVPSDDVALSADDATLDFTPASQGPRPKRGYCRCSCSFTPDCATNADCGGSLCLKGPTCC